MKTIRLCICLCTVFYVNSLLAQEELGNGFVLPQFENGFVIFKNGTRTSAVLNYNMINQEMMFMSNENVMMEFADLSVIQSIIIGERCFVPVSSKRFFYEEVVSGNGSFFVQHVAYNISQGKEAPYGGYSQTSSTTSIGSIENGSTVRLKLSIAEKFKLKKEEYYYIKSGNNYKRFTTAKSLGKLFKGQTSKIETFAKDQSINFSKSGDISKIVEYAYSLMNN